VPFAGLAQAGKEPVGSWNALDGGNPNNFQLCMNPACICTAVCYKKHGTE